jgi:hypothetical protein
VFSDQEFSRAWDVEGEVTEKDFEELTDDISTYGDETEDFRTVNTGDPERIFHVYEEWECYKAGFYDTHKDGMAKADCEEAYRAFLADPGKFSEALERVTAEWINSCEHYLTNTSMNRIAWLGQAAACYSIRIPSAYRGGFWLLSPEQQAAANGVALDYLNRWLTANGRAAVVMAEAISEGRQAEIY